MAALCGRSLPSLVHRSSSEAFSSLASVRQRLGGQASVSLGMARREVSVSTPAGSGPGSADAFFFIKEKEAERTIDPKKAQVLRVYEINEGDRHSPAVLALSRSPFNSQAPTLAKVVDANGNPVLAIGDLVPFSNKLYDGSLTLRLGITAGTTAVIKTVPEKNGQRFEANYSFYFGDYGHVTIQGPYLTYQDTELAVVGGAGIFRGVYGFVKLHQIIFPTKLFYTFYLFGIPPLPDFLLKKHVEPDLNVVPSAAAVQGAPEASLPNYTD